VLSTRWKFTRCRCSPICQCSKSHRIGCESAHGHFIDNASGSLHVPFLYPPDEPTHSSYSIPKLTALGALLQIQEFEHANEPVQQRVEGNCIWSQPSRHHTVHHLLCFIHVTLLSPTFHQGVTSDLIKKDKREYGHGETFSFCSTAYLQCV